MIFDADDIYEIEEHYKIKLEEKDKEIERLNKRVKEVEDAYLRVRHQYSELEGKYVINENIIKEFEKLIKNEINESKLEDDYDRADSLEYCLATLRELRGDSSNGNK